MFNTDDDVAVDLLATVVILESRKVECDTKVGDCVLGVEKTTDAFLVTLS